MSLNCETEQGGACRGLGRAYPDRMKKLQPTVVTALLAGTLLACALMPGCAPTWHPIQRDFALGMQATPGQDATAVKWYCQEGVCQVAQEVTLNEGDVQGAMLQEGEAQATIVLRLSDDGAAKVATMLRGRSPSRQVVFVQDGKALVVQSRDALLKRKELRLKGPTAPIHTLYERMTE